MRRLSEGGPRALKLAKYYAGKDRRSAPRSAFRQKANVRFWRIEALPYRVGEFAKSPDFKGDWLRRMRSIAPFL